MIYSVTGKLIHVESNLAVVQCGGVGFKCLTTMTTIAKLPQIGSEVTLYTHLNVREDALDLYGFYDMAELNCYKMLTSVSGVGPKVGLSILSDSTPERLALNIAAGDSKALTKAQGVGPKLAQRIVLELKDKVGAAEIAEGLSETPAAGLNLQAGNAGEAISALTVLGYSQTDAAAIIAKLDPAMPVEEMIKTALKQMAFGR